MPAYRVPRSVGIKIFLMPEDVREVIRRTQEDIDALQATVSACRNLDPDTRAAWEGFVADWASFDKSVSLIPLFYQHQYGQVVDYRMRARAWEPVLREKCGGLQAPSIQPDVSQGIASIAGSTWTGVEIGLGVGALGLLAFVLLSRK